MEWLKHVTDKLIIRFLHVTSQFEKQLTGSGRIEQQRWRVQRLRDLQGLALRWQQRRRSVKP